MKFLQGVHYRLLSYKTHKGLDDRFAQAYMERYQSSGNYRHHHTGQSSKYPLDETIPDMRSQGFRHVYGFNQWGHPTIHKDASAKEKHESFELEFKNPMNTIESIAVKAGKSHDTGLPWMYWTMVADREPENDDYRRFVKGPDVKERHPFWRMQPVPEKEKYLTPPHPHFKFERYPPRLMVFTVQIVMSFCSQRAEHFIGNHKKRTVGNIRGRH